jgi:general stress protein 26
MADNAEFWKRVHEASAKMTWAYLATAVGDQPKVRVVHPAWEGEKLWVATGRASSKAHQIERNPKVELFYQIGQPDFIHVTVTGRARFVDDLKEKERIWNGKVFDYELNQFWPEGARAKEFGLMLVTPARVEITSMPEMMQGKKPAVWRARPA